MTHLFSTSPLSNATMSHSINTNLSRLFMNNQEVEPLISPSGNDAFPPKDSSPHQTSTSASNRTPRPSQQPSYASQQNPYHDPSFDSYRSTADRTLPVGWEVFYDTEKTPYYCNMSSGRTQWAHPTTGIQANKYSADIDVPDYSLIQAQQQQRDMDVFSPDCPDMSEKPDESSPYNPHYYDASIQKKIDPNVLNQDQLDSLSTKWVDFDKYTRALTSRQRVCGTIGKNKVLTILTALVFASLAAYIILILWYIPEHPIKAGEKDDRYTQFAFPLKITYGLYFLLFILPAGICPLFFLCCGCSPCLSDKPVETLRASACSSTAAMKQTIQTIKAGSPSLTMNIECYHHETRVEYVTVTSKDSNGKKTTSRERREKQVKGAIPIIRWRDLSASELTVADIAEQCDSNVISVNYQYLYELHPLQQSLLTELRSQYYHSYRHIDTHTSVTMSYHLSCTQPSVDVFVKKKHCGYCLSRVCFFNAMSLFLWMYIGLLLPFMMLFRTFIRPVPYYNTKYLHIGRPSAKDDVCTFGFRTQSLFELW